MRQRRGMAAAAPIGAVHPARADYQLVAEGVPLLYGQAAAHEPVEERNAMRKARKLFEPSSAVASPSLSRREVHGTTTKELNDLLILSRLTRHCRE